MGIKKFKIKDTVYHGTVKPFDDIELEKGRGNKDFGKGFYLAYNKKQALDMIRLRAREYKRRKDDNVEKTLYTYTVDNNIIDGLNIKVFEEIDLEWLDFVLKCRSVNGKPHDYDIVIGPTADDDMRYCLNAYREGVYGNVGSIEARRTLLNNLEVENLGTQLYIGTERGLMILKDRKAERV